MYGPAMLTFLKLKIQYEPYWHMKKYHLHGVSHFVNCNIGLVQNRHKDCKSSEKKLGDLSKLT